jgi:hypothetical protein
VIGIPRYVVKRGFILGGRPRLDRIARSADFVRVSGQVNEWVDGQFAQIERGAPWLTRHGQDVHQYLMTASRELGVMRGAILSAVPASHVTTVYGWDGRLSRRLAELERVLAGQGWRDFNPSPVTVYQPTFSREEPWANSPMAETGPPVRATWQPAGEPDRPDGAVKTARDADGRDLFRAQFLMDVGWAGRGDPPGPVSALGTTRQGGDQLTPFYRPVKYRSADIRALSGDIRQAGGNVIAIKITVFYKVK